MACELNELQLEKSEVLVWHVSHAIDSRSVCNWFSSDKKRRNSITFLIANDLERERESLFHLDLNWKAYWKSKQKQLQLQV